MKIIKAAASLIALLFIFNASNAQEVDLTKGDLSILQSETSINLEFTYDKMTVGDDGKEADYIKRKRTEFNDKEKGSGEIWAAKWELDKKEKYEPKFILGFTNLSKMTVSADAKYTLIFNTKALEPGYSIGISKKNAGIDGTVTIVETANRAKKLATLNVERPAENKWRGAAFDAGSRIADAYYLSGQKIGKFIKSNNK
ncbi:MAG TPA: hypothetical protein VK489_15700 [Ferruginibacter sp.]|nr:hypothetical protein [Ferruginibacter sp.]